MTIKEYLQIEDQFFTLSNEHLFIRHGNGEEFVMTLHDKKKHINPNIPEQNTSLAHHFQLPITPDHNNTLIYKDLIVYQERYKKHTKYRYSVDSITQPDSLLTFTLTTEYTHRLNIALHPRLKKESIPLTKEQREQVREDLLDLWEPILNPPHKIKLIEYLTDSLQTTGNITNMSDQLMGVDNYVPMAYE